MWYEILQSPVFAFVIGTIFGYVANLLIGLQVILFKPAKEDNK